MSNDDSLNAEDTTYDQLPEVNSRDEIPKFANDEEAAEFWNTHSFGPGLLTMARRRSPEAHHLDSQGEWNLLPGDFWLSRTRRQPEYKRLMQDIDEYARLIAKLSGGEEATVELRELHDNIEWALRRWIDELELQLAKRWTAERTKSSLDPG